MFTLQGGPPIAGPAEQLGGPGLSANTNILDIEPFLDKHCSRHNSGSYCKATTTDGVELFKSVQIAVNAAAGTLKSRGALDLFTPLKVDGVLGPATARLASEVLMALEPLTQRAKVWLDDPRSVKVELMAPLLAAQPQYAKETFEEIATAGLTTPPTLPPQPEQPTQPAPTEPAPTEPAPVPKPTTPQPAAAPKVFWTRKKKIVAMAGVGVLALGLLVTVLWMRKRDH
jgi:hypothetical protein